MSDSKIQKCHKCGQQLRIPTNVGGILMKCPACGQKIHSDFKIIKGKAQPPQVKKTNIVLLIFEIPGKLLDKLIRYVIK